ncbi:MAG: agmatine deiminase family protein [Balneolaceae bacterium]|nr:MAG: agmatine deiminase family protein [Balneolaceae bacterium]
MNTPKELGYRMPAEWETHAATQLHWPSNRETWPGERLERVEAVYLEIIKALHTHEPIVLLVDPKTDADKIVEKLSHHNVNLSAVHLFNKPVNDVWARDCGPIFIKKRNEHQFAITDWEYNAWGGKYPPYDADNALPGWFSEAFEIEKFSPGIVLEGGSIDTNGQGVFLTTESVLLNKNRNPQLSKEQIEAYLADYLGAEKIIWLKDGLAGDDTDGHIDDLSRFLSENTILTMISEDPDDVNYNALQENYEILERARNIDGDTFEIITLPLPKTKIEGTTVDGSEYVPASYANFYIANGVILLPLYDKSCDEQAINLFEKYFPERKVTGIPCADLVWGQGSIHCITQQLYGIDF